MSGPCKFPSLDSCKKFLWTHKGADLAPHSVVGLVLRVEDAEKFPHALSFESLDPFFKVGGQGPYFTALEEDGGDKKLVELVKLMLLSCQILFSLFMAEANPMRISAEQVPSLHRVVLETGHPFKLLAVHANTCVDAVGVVGHDLALF